MKDEYDFSTAERGKFHRPGARVRLPIYLDDDVIALLEQRAAAEGVSIADLVNDLLRHDVGLER